MLFIVKNIIGISFNENPKKGGNPNIDIIIKKNKRFINLLYIKFSNLSNNQQIIIFIKV